jgi:hypothetical protein
MPCHQRWGQSPHVPVEELCIRPIPLISQLITRSTAHAYEIDFSSWHRCCLETPGGRTSSPSIVSILDKKSYCWQPLAARNPEMTKSRGGELKGLCMTCSKAGDCALPRASELPILRCDAYQAFKPVQVPPIDSSAGQNVPFKAEEHRGLCSDCEVRDDCSRLKPESGVWRCEYYR